MIRRMVFWVHLCIGLLALLPMAFLAFTGFMLSFEPLATESWSKQTRTLRTQAVGERRPLDALVESAMGSESGRITSIAILPDSTAFVELREAKRRFVRVNPWSGRVQDRTGVWQEFFGIVEDLHQRLALGESGRTVTGTSALACLLLSISGIVVWWPRKRAALQNVVWPRKGLHGRARNWQWHNAMGFLAALPLFSIGLTGIVMAFPWAESALLAITRSHEPERIVPKTSLEVHKSRSAPAAGERRWQTWLDSATAYAPPGWTSLRLRAPAKAGKDVVVNVQGHGDGPSGGTMTLAPDGTFLSFAPTGTDFGHRLRSLVRPLHTGLLMGFPGQLAVALASLVALVLVWTGAALSWRRLLH